MSRRIAFQMDALEKLNIPRDSTLYIAQVAALRGDELFHYQPQHLRMDFEEGTRRITATGHRLHFDAAAAIPWSLGEEKIVDLSVFDILMMRQDPPFDLAYITATHILEHLRHQVRIINDPIGVRNAPEKLLTSYLPEFLPPTLITRDVDAIYAFRDKHHDVIVKPLYSYGSRGVFHIPPDDDNLPSLLESMSALNNEQWIIQKFLPIASLGDKRIILLGGEVMGAFRRMPLKNDIRSSTRTGAPFERCDVTVRDHDICSALKPLLQEHGLFWVGLDVIGDYLTEINVTSPGGFVHLDTLEERMEDRFMAKQFWSKLGI